jgi:hypothetical protein
MVTHATPPMVKDGVVAATALDPKLVPNTDNTTLPSVGADEGVIEVIDGGKKENDCVEVLKRPGKMKGNTRNRSIRGENQREQ